jgi:hypothetical protein
MNDSVRNGGSRSCNVGTRHNLPEDIRSCLADAHVLAWTSFDEKWEGSISRATCCLEFGPCFVDPCCWPFLIPCWPLVWMKKKSTETDIRNTFWILTDQDVKMFVRGANGFGGCGKNGDVLWSIPLSQIVECSTEPVGCSTAPTEGCCRNCKQSVLPALVVYTYRSHCDFVKQKSLVGYGLKGFDWFATAILRQRNAERAVRETPIMDRGDGHVEHDVLVSSMKLIQNGSSIKNLGTYPHNVGTGHTLPEEIRIRLGTTSNVIAWTTLDDQWERMIGPATWCSCFILAFIFLLFWPLVIGYPYLWQERRHQEHSIRHSYWILTDTEVKIFVGGSDGNCLCYFDETLSTIPLTQITGIRLRIPGKNCLVKGLESIPNIIIDSVYTPTEDKIYEASGHGLAGSEWFVAAIVNQIYHLHGGITRQPV